MDSDKDQLLNEIQKLLEGMEQRFDAKIEALKVELREYVYDTETRLMRAFTQWQLSSEARLKGIEVNLIPLLERQSALEARQAELERRLNALEHPDRH